MGNVVATVQREYLAKISSRPQLHVESLQEQKKKVLFVSSEFADMVKVGGLGDVSAALPRALAARHDIRVLIPGYSEVMQSGNPIRVVGKIEGLAAIPSCRIGRMDLSDGLIVYVVICPELYEREGYPYGDSRRRDWPDNHIRFARLGLAAAEIAAGRASISWSPQLVHAHDWPSALAPAYMAWRGQSVPSIFTVHNLTYQGFCDPQCIRELGIPPEANTPHGMEFYGQLSFLKAGIAYASHITTVSKTYAREITTPEAGCGLDGILRYKAEQGLLSGIANGIDESWDPRTDRYLIDDGRDLENGGKATHARYVEQKLGLERDSGPLFAVVSRLVQQKGIDLTIEVASTIVAEGGRIAAIGRGEPELEAAMEQLAQRYPGRVGVEIDFNELDARRMFAGSDFLLMPSRFEPCGLSQMYAQRFGSLPVATRTGGLADTIEDGVTGFLFDGPSIENYRRAVLRAINVYRHPQLMEAMRRKATAAPLYWHQSVEPYDQLYRRLAQEKQAMTAGMGRRS